MSADTKVLAAMLERTTKYTKQWSARYFTFDPTTRKMTYGKDEKSGPKGTIMLTKIVRLSEQFEFKPNMPDIYSINVDGTLDDGKAEQWSVRFPDHDAFTTWYQSIRGAIAAVGLMDAFNFGLPTIDPRYNLAFAAIPLENLHKFGLLEKAIVYFFGGCCTHTKDVNAALNATASILGASTVDTYFVVGDKYVYTFRPGADVVRCFLLSAVSKIHYSATANFVCVQVQAPEADLVLKNVARAKELVDVLCKVYKVNSQTEEIPVVPITATSVENFVETCAGLRMQPSADFKTTVASPTPKTRLKFALDMYEKKNGSTFGQTSKGEKSASGSDAKAGSSPNTRNPNATASSTGASTKGGAAPAAAPNSLGGKETDFSVPLVRLLHNLKLQQYIVPLLSQHVDLDVLQCMDEADLMTFGVKNPAHRKLILDAASDGGRLESTDSIDVPPLVEAPAAKPNVVLTSPQKKEIVLSDDDDVTPVVKAPLILLDDSDDDLLPIVGVASPQQAPAPKPINLDDDDDI